MSSAPAPAAGSTAFPSSRWSAVLLVALAVHLLYLGFGSPSSFQRRTVAAWWAGKAGQTGHYYQAVDLMALNWTHDGNVLLKFSGYDPRKPADAREMGTLFYRSCYRAYPARFYITAEDLPRPLSLVNPPEFQPDREWLRARRVTSQVVIRKTADGPEYDLQPLR